MHKTIKHESSNEIVNESENESITGEIYQKISHKQRIDVIYSYQVHNLKLKEISELHGIKYNTVRNILKVFS